MNKFGTYKRISTKEEGKNGLGLKAQERDMKLFFENYADTPYEVIGDFIEVQSGNDNTRKVIRLSR